jgi:predicted transcriptional regulator
MALGELERAVMGVLWSREDSPWSVREVSGSFPDHAYTTIMTVLSRLRDKGFVSEEKVGRANVYRPTASREQYVADLMSDALALADDRSVVLAHFAATMDDGDRAVLARLMRRK